MPKESHKGSNWPDPVQIQLSGSGGQGLVLAGIILAAAAITDGRYVIQTQSYGPEARGGASRAEVIIGSQLIDYPRVEKPDVLLSLTQEACSKYLPFVHGHGLVIVDSLLVEKVPQTSAEVLRLPVIQTARYDIGKEVVANIVALGALNAVANLVSWPSLVAAVVAKVPAGFTELNQHALEAGRALVMRLQATLLPKI